MNRTRLHAGMTVLTFSAALCASRVALARTPAQAAGQEQQTEGPARNGIPGGQMVRGVVTDVYPDHLTLKQEDGTVYQVVATSNTRITKQRQPAKLTDLKPGDGLGAAGVLDASTKTIHAAMIFAVDAADLRKAQENLGKTYVTGKITAIEDLRLTVARPDGVAQVLEVDEGTSFRRGGRGGANAMFPGAGPAAGAPDRSSAAQTPETGNRSAGGESITLADVKVGDSIFATGVLKSGVFHPAELRVSNPHHRREGAPSNSAPAALPQ